MKVYLNPSETTVRDSGGSDSYYTAKVFLTYTMQQCGSKKVSLSLLSSGATKAMVLNL